MKLFTSLSLIALSTSAFANVTLYSGSNGTGSAYNVTTSSIHSIGATYPGGNDNVSSVSIPANTCVAFYMHDGFEGTS